MHLMLMHIVNCAHVWNTLRLNMEALYFALGLL